MSTTPHPVAPHHLPAFITAPGETDVLLVIMGIVLIVVVLVVGNLFLTLHTLPERMAHKSKKLQFEIVAVLGLLALFTHQHVFWVAGLLLAVIDLPDFSSPLRRIAGSVEKLAGIKPGEGSAAAEELERARLAAQDTHEGPGTEEPGTEEPGTAEPGTAEPRTAEPRTHAPRPADQDKHEEPKPHSPRRVGQEKHEEPMTHA